MHIFVRFSATVFFVLLFFVFNISGQEIVPEIGKPVERELKGGEVHNYRIQLAAGQFLYIVAVQNGIDVVLTINWPDGAKLDEVDSPNGKRGEEPLWFVAETDGNYQIEVRSLEKDAETGRYQIDLRELRDGTADDKYFVAAKQAVREAVKFTLSKDKDADARAKVKIEEAARLYELIQLDKPAKASGFSQMGRIYRSRQQKELSLSYFDRAASLFEETGLKREAAMAIVDSAGSAVSQTDVLRRNERVLALAKEIGDRKLEVSSLMEIGNSYYYLGDFSRSLEINRQALQLAEEIGYADRIPRIFGNLGNVYNARSDFARALESHHNALEGYQRTGNLREIPSTILNIGNVYFGLGNYPLALENFQKAQAEFEKIKAPVGTAYAISNIGNVYLETGDYDKALEYFLKAQPMKSRFLPDDPTSFYNIAAVYKGTGRFKESLEYTEKALDLCQKTADTDCKMRTLIQISDTLAELHDYSKALDVAKEAILLGKQFDYTNHLWSAQMSAAKAEFGLGKTADARRSLEISISIIDQLRTKITGDEDSRQRFFEQKSDPFRMMIDLLIVDQKPEKALALAEHIKARALLEVLETGRIDITRAMTTTESLAEKELRNELASLNSQVSDENDKIKLDKLRIHLDQKRLDFEELQMHIYAAHPELKMQRGDMKPVTPEETAELLANSNCALLEFVVDADKTYLFVITKDSYKNILVKSYLFRVTKGELTKQVEVFRDHLANGDLDFQKESRELHDLLLKPAAAQLAGKTNLIIVPDGPLWDLPFQAMQNGQNQYLVEQASLSYAPSLTALREMSKKAKRTRQNTDLELLAFGNPVVGKETAERVQRVFMSEKLGPIPEAERLVNSLGKMYGPTKCKIYTGSSAREETAKSESPKYRIVLFATHGILNNVSPMYSHLVLAQDEKSPNEDGLLEAWEMKDLDLKVDMVILSACETARGRVASGEGVIGMSWALFIAGTPTTVASQWKIESSSTTELMLEFHRQLLTGKVSKAEALRRASLKVMKMPKYRHPSYWAGFVIVGDGS